MSKVNIAINGFGRIGRHAFKVAFEKKNFKIVAINDLTDTKTLAHLLKHDTAYWEYSHKVAFDGNHLIVDKTHIETFAEKDPAGLPWKKKKVDVVIESTGVFRNEEGASKHLQAGARKVVISAPGKDDAIKTFVRGANCEDYKGEKLIDSASCTTNCAAPIMRVLKNEFGVKKAMLTTVHSYTADQRLQDGPHKDLRRARAAGQNIIPTTTGAAIATSRVIAGLDKKFDGMAIRVPTITVSLNDFTLLLQKKVTAEEINKAFKKAAKTYLKGILAVVEEPLVSTDFIGNAYSANIDLALTKVVGGDLVKIIAWYDNEWGYANRLVEMVEIVGKTK